MNKFFVSILFGLMLLSGAYAGTDVIAPTTTFSSFQVANTSDQNITLTCTDNNSGCKAINYKIDNRTWIYGNDLNQYNITSSNDATERNIVGPQFDVLMNSYSITDINKNYIEQSSVFLKRSAGGTSNNQWAYVTYVYTDGTSSNSNTNYNDGTSYSKVTFTGSDISKDINNIKLYMSVNYSGLTGYEKDFNYIIRSYYYSLTKSINFLFSGVGDHNIQYFSSDNSDNNEAINTSTFTTYGGGHFQFYDENTGLALTGVSVDGNTALIGNTYDTNLQGITAQTKTYTFTKSGYSTRYYTRDINQLSDFNVQFALLPTTLSTALTFTLRQPTTLTAMTSATVTITKGTNTVFRGVTDSLAALKDIYLNADNNAARYAMNIVYGANTYDWNGLTLTISVPKNEKNTATTISPFDATITGVASYNLTNKTTAQTIVLFTDLQYTTPYSVIIGDYNATVYNDRRYDLWFTGLTTAYTLQPYLLLTADSTAIKFITLNEYNNPVQGIRIDVSKTLGGVKTLMSSSRTDATGIALFYLYVNDQYQLDMYYEDTALYSSTNYTVTTSPVYFYLNLTTLSVTSVDQNGSSITWNTGYNIPTTTTSLITTITNASAATISYFQYDANDGSTGGASHVMATATAVCTSGTCTITKTMADLITGGLDNNKQFYATVTVIATTGYSFTQTTVFLYNYLGKASIQQLFVNVRKDFSCNPDIAYPCSPLLIISIILTIIAIATIFTMFGYSGTTGISILTLIILGLFTYIGWFYWVLFIPIAAVIILANARSFTGGGFYG